MNINELFNESLVWVEVPKKLVPLKLPCTYQDNVFKSAEDTPPVFTKEQMEENRLRLYADPINGSDRYFSEATSLIAAGFKSESPEVQEVYTKGIARKREIQVMFPYPEEA